VESLLVNLCLIHLISLSTLRGWLLSEKFVILERMRTNGTQNETRNELLISTFSRLHELLGFVRLEGVFVNSSCFHAALPVGKTHDS
jgi:hypothetical protein